MLTSAMLKKTTTKKNRQRLYTSPVKIQVEMQRKAAPVNMHINLVINTEPIAKVMNKYKQTYVRSFHTNV